MEIQAHTEAKQFSPEVARKISAILENGRRRYIRIKISQLTFVVAVFLAGAIVGGLVVSL